MKSFVKAEESSLQTRIVKHLRNLSFSLQTSSTKSDHSRARQAPPRLDIYKVRGQSMKSFVKVEESSLQTRIVEYLPKLSISLQTSSTKCDRSGARQTPPRLDTYKVRGQPMKSFVKAEETSLQTRIVEYLRKLSIGLQTFSTKSDHSEAR